MQADDGHNLAQLLKTMQTIFKVQQPKNQMRHSHKPRVAHELAEMPLAVPELPAQLAPRPEMISTLRGYLLKSRTDTTVVAAVFRPLHESGGFQPHAEDWCD